MQGVVAAEALSQQQYRRVGSSSCLCLVSVICFYYMLQTYNQTALVGILASSRIYTLCVALDVCNRSLP